MIAYGYAAIESSGPNSQLTMHSHERDWQLVFLWQQSVLCNRYNGWCRGIIGFAVLGYTYDLVINSFGTGRAHVEKYRLVIVDWKAHTMHPISSVTSDRYNDYANKRNKCRIDACSRYSWLRRQWAYKCHCSGYQNIAVEALSFCMVRWWILHIKSVWPFHWRHNKSNGVTCFVAIIFMTARRTQTHVEKIISQISFNH